MRKLEQVQELSEVILRVLTEKRCCGYGGSGSKDGEITAISNLCEEIGEHDHFQHKSTDLKSYVTQNDAKNGDAV